MNKFKSLFLISTAITFSYVLTSCDNSAPVKGSVVSYETRAPNGLVVSAEKAPYGSTQFVSVDTNGDSIPDVEATREIGLNGTPVLGEQTRDIKLSVGDIVKVEKRLNEKFWRIIEIKKNNQKSR